ncbi:zona pellucida sperm-binding protein 4-like [Eucyclogobius newberryi]|uniref:zona pellucida sperm-binding protein 4-like n=1 Tax=Eucyclogobius newberryi TaxID=166745 RepID=UPI003B5A9337
MGPNRVECVGRLTWTLLLVGLVQGWTELSDSQLKNILDGRYSLHPVKPHEKLPIKFEAHEDDYDDADYDDYSFYDKGLKSELYEPETTTAAPGPDIKDSTGFDFTCAKNAFQISIAKKEVDNVKVIGLKNLLSLQEAAKTCGYLVNREQGTLTVPFTGCFVKIDHLDFSVQLLLAEGSQVRTATCPRPVPSGPSPRAVVPPVQPSLVCPFTTLETPSAESPQDRVFLPSKSFDPEFLPLQRLSPIGLPPVQPPGNCAVPTLERLSCGSSSTTMTSCQSMGCCWDMVSSSCFYPMDECTNDHYFVFAIYHDSASIPLDTASLVIPGTTCEPLILTDTVAVFKFKMDECGTRGFTVGGTQVYLAEVQTAVETLNLKYGAISRSSQLRFLIECRYSSSDKTSLASTGYMVKTPSSMVPSVLYSDGLYGVELKLAKDDTYSSFYPTYHQPLRFLLGRTVYLQLLLLSPTPKAVLLVNYCIAYPRSASNALVLVHEGCANPFDPHSAVLINGDFGQPKNERRFVVKAFQFMEQNTNTYLDEEIYFMCSTEVCFPNEKMCQERCFDGVAP